MDTYSKRNQDTHTRAHTDRQTDTERETERERERGKCCVCYVLCHEGVERRSGAASSSFDLCESPLEFETLEDDKPAVEETPKVSSTSSTVSASRRPIVSGMKDDDMHARPPSDPKTIKGR